MSRLNRFYQVCSKKKDKKADSNLFYIFFGSPVFSCLESPTFRRSQTEFLPNLIFAGIVGYATGNYIFKESVQDYWEEENSSSKAAQVNNDSNNNGSPKDNASK